MDKLDSDSLLFLKYLESQGFKCDDYHRILELFQSANNSLSQYLTEYNQYLLSRAVNYSELDALGINGGFGYLDNYGGILIPKCFINDDRFLYDGVKRPYIKHSYDAPTIDQFDTIIGRIPSNVDDEVMQQLFASLFYNSQQSQYFGLCLDTQKTENTKQLISLYYYFVKELNSSFGDKIFTFEHDTIQSKGKELCLIKRSKK